ncbi:MAG TPA: hypothetical protein VFD16_01770 [Candidatus Saccharimonadales bacterium]|nr:hypothetical protein [Candidatus Saccharimonadales bacterium]
MSQEKHEPASGSKIIWTLLFAGLIFWVIKILPEGKQFQSFLYLVSGTYFLIIFTKLFFRYREYAKAGAYLLFYVGVVLAFLFVLWLGNMALTALNPLFSALGIDFKIGHLFPGVYNFIFSLPGLICGAILIVAGALWEHSDSRLNAFKMAFYPGK